MIKDKQELLKGVYYGQTTTDSDVFIINVFKKWFRFSCLYVCYNFILDDNLCSQCLACTHCMLKFA